MYWRYRMCWPYCICWRCRMYWRCRIIGPAVLLAPPYCWPCRIVGDTACIGDTKRRRSAFRMFLAAWISQLWTVLHRATPFISQTGLSFPATARRRRRTAEVTKQKADNRSCPPRQRNRLWWGGVSHIAHIVDRCHFYPQSLFNLVYTSYNFIIPDLSCLSIRFQFPVLDKVLHPSAV